MATTARSLLCSRCCRMTSTRSSPKNSFSRSRSASASLSKRRRSFCSLSISDSRAAHSRVSCSSISRLRSAKEASSVIGGSAASKARFWRARSIISTSASPAGRPSSAFSVASASTSGSPPSATV